MNLINEAEIWFIDNGILPSSVMYNAYQQQNLVSHWGATLLVGIGKNRFNKNIGFAIEVIPNEGVVAGGILESEGVASWDKKAQRIAVMQNRAMIDVLQELALSHRQASQQQIYQHTRQKPDETVVDAQPVEPKPNPVHTKPFILPFILKSTPQFTVVSSINDSKIGEGVIKFIKRLGVGYLKSRLANPDDFVFHGFASPQFPSSGTPAEMVQIIGKFIHDYVWYLITQNTPIDGSQRLIYGIKYTPYILEITNNLNKNSLILGVQIYCESLIDYYISKMTQGKNNSYGNHVKTNSRDDNTNNDMDEEDEQQSDKKTGSWKDTFSFIVTCIGFYILFKVLVQVYMSYKSEDKMTVQQAQQLVHNAANGQNTLHENELVQKSIIELDESLTKDSSDSNVQKNLQQATNETNKILPITLDEITTWTKQTANYRQLINDYTISATAAQLNITTNDIAAVKQEIIHGQNICTELYVYPKHNIILSYRYYDKNNLFLFQVDVRPNDCMK